SIVRLSANCLTSYPGPVRRCRVSPASQCGCWLASGTEGSNRVSSSGESLRTPRRTGRFYGGMDNVDLYQIHRFDQHTPIEEMLEALHDVVKAGKARYIGASSMHAWQFARALGIAESKQRDPFCQHAEPRQLALSRGGARNAAAVQGRRNWRHPPAG